MQEGSEVFAWISKQIGESRRIVDSFRNLINTALTDALGPPGVFGDPVKIVYVSRGLQIVTRQRSTGLEKRKGYQSLTTTKG